MKKHAALVVARSLVALSLCACSTLGTPASPSGPLPHGGTGQFRALTQVETMLGSSPVGLTLDTTGFAIDDAMPFEGNLFYAAGAALPTPDAGTDAAVVPDSGIPDAGVDAAIPRDASVSSDAAVDSAVDGGPIAPADVNWSLFAARQIFRSTIGNAWGFASGTMVFSASASWEGGYVTDPWVVQRADGRFLLYYAAAGGIGVASAASMDGPWTREGSGPILATSADGTPRRPSAIVTTGLEGAPAAMIVYYELAGEIHIATSADGIALTDAGTIPTMPIAARDDRDGDELSVGAPGAISVLTPAGRHVVRIYYESVRTNGTVLVAMLGSGDGIHFDQTIVPVFAERDRRRAAARYIDERTTVLYAWVASGLSGAEIASVTPAAVQLAGVTPPPF